jgi:hypothetical protein
LSGIARWMLWFEFKVGVAVQTRKRGHGTNTVSTSSNGCE